MKRASVQTLDPQLQKRFQERASLFAKKEKVHDIEQKSSYIKFNLHQECYGIHFSDCAQVLADQTITAMPFSRPFIKGVIQFDGAFLTVVDLLEFFGYGHVPTNGKQSIIMINHPRLSLGFLVNHIVGRDFYSSPELTESLRDEFAKNKKYILGVHHGNTAILNIDAIVEDVYV